MPQYDFFCEICGKEETLFQKMAEYAPPPCCEKPMQQRISAAGFILKGEWPGQEIKRENQDERIRDVAKRARELKESGKVPMEEHINFSDVERMNPG